MEWTEIKVNTASEAVEAVANILIEAGANGVAIEDSKDVERYVADNLGEVIDKEQLALQATVVKAYYPASTFLPELISSIQNRLDKLASYGLAVGQNTVETSQVAETDWATAWKKYYHPVTISRYLTIVPSWEEYQSIRPLENIIKLDPGMAFGTGTHPTTILSLHALELYLRGGETVLDVGTGSGVLSIASKLYGAEHVYAYDLDQVAVEAAKENMALNPLANDVNVSANNLLAGVTQEADIIVANILADIILNLLPDAYRLLRPTGFFIVSGIIQEKQAEVLEKALEQGFVLVEEFKQQDWSAFVLRKRTDEDE